jgi:hypothetical protein
MRTGTTSSAPCQKKVGLAGAFGFVAGALGILLLVPQRKAVALEKCHGFAKSTPRGETVVAGMVLNLPGNHIRAFRPEKI